MEIHIFLIKSSQMFNKLDSISDKLYKICIRLKTAEINAPYSITTKIIILENVNMESPRHYHNQ